jgi:diguanylate cyclase
MAVRSTAPPTDGRRQGQWRVFAVAGVAATLLYVADLSPVVNTLAFALIGAGTVVACLVGPRRFGAEPRSTWSLIGAAALLFLVGVVVRPWAAGQLPPWSLLPDAATVPGYLVLGVFAVLLLQARQSIERHVVLDALIVCLAGGLASALLLAAPAAEAQHTSAVTSVLAGLYPLFDVILLLFVVNLTFTAITWPFSLVTLLGVLTLMLIGDLSYAVLGIFGKTYESPVYDLPFLLAYVLLGVTTLHPSVVQLSQAARQPVQAWSWRRMSLLAPAMAVPSVLLVTVGGHSFAARLTIGLVGGAMVALLLVRAVSAVQAHVAAQLHSEHQAMHDPLTGLPNRRMISAEIERLLASLPPAGIERVWVYFLDLDGFKWVNDSWGHDTGDQLVIEVGARLRAALPAGTMLARVGGDEFLLAYVGDQAGALRLVEEIRDCFARPLRVRDTDVVISASIGIAHAAGDGSPAVTAEALMRDADTAMYRSKAEGPGRSTVFDTSMHDRVRERIELEAALRTALAEGQLRVAYQPIVALDTGRPVGAEALVRWDHPVRGAIPPMTFIPVAEDAGLIGAIGTWVRNQALRQLAEWRADGTVTDDFYLSVNVSPRQLNDSDLPLIVSAELLRHGVPARAVALEMTESVMVDGSSVTARVLFELRELGVRLLVDDFGTGFSALGYLRRFPVTGVKIDRSFVSGLGRSVADEEIVRAVVAMGYALGLSIVAEGVETRMQRDALAAVGVTQGQGWLWGPAVAPGDFARHWHAGAAPQSGRRPGRDQLAAGNS